MTGGDGKWQRECTDFLQASLNAYNGSAGTTAQQLCYQYLPALFDTDTRWGCARRWCSVVQLHCEQQLASGKPLICPPTSPLPTPQPHPAAPAVPLCPPTSPA